MAVSKAIDRVIDKITDLKQEMHQLRHDMHTQIHGLKVEMNNGFASLDKRVVAIETRLGMIGEKQKGFYERWMDYLFKAGYGALTFVLAYLAYLVIHINLVIK